MRAKNEFIISYKFFVKCCTIIKLVTNVLVTLYDVAFLTHENCQCQFKSTSDRFLLIGMLVFTIVDTVFTTLTALGAFYSKYTSVRTFYYYSIVVTLAEIITVMMIGFSTIYGHSEDTNCNLLYIFFLMGVLWIVIDVFVMVVLQGEIADQYRYGEDDISDCKEKEAHIKFNEDSGNPQSWKEHT